MARLNLTVTPMGDGTVVVKTGRKVVEAFDITHLGMLQTYERLKFSAMLAGTELGEETLVELLHIARRLK